MSNNPPSVRFPFTLPEGTHPQVAAALRYSFNGLLDLNQAIKKLVPMVNNHGTTIENITQTINQTSGGGGGGGGSTPSFGAVNLQPNPPGTTYTMQQSDLAGLIGITSASPFALALNSGLVTPFFTVVYNFGPATVTMTPTLGLVNNTVSLDVVANQFAIAYFDGTNWWVAYPLLAKSFPHVTSNWLDSYDAATGLFTSSQPSTANMADSTTGHGHIVLDSGPTIVNLNVTGILKIIPVTAFPNNASAIAGGLIPGDVYRTGSDPDVLCIVH